MVILNIILILIPAILAAQCFLNISGALEKIGVIIFFSLTIVPFFNINYALLTGSYISNNLTIINSILPIIIFSIIILCCKRKNDLKRICTISSVSKDELLVLAISISLAVFMAYYYSNKEFILSLASYFTKGDAECFYMQTFKTIEGLNQDFTAKITVSKVYEIICTPGNILFTSTLLPVLKLYSFKMIYVLFTWLLFVFVYLIVNKLIKHRIIALLTAIFAVLNPYILSVEVLDRNIMALTISAILFYLLLEHKNKIFLHGLVFGILAGTGLRFIPLLFIFPIAILYRKEHFNFKTILIFISAFIITFTFNIPHFYFHGLNSLGETESSSYLVFEAFTKYARTPFLPYPNVLFYVFNILNYFGYFIFGIILIGAFKLWRTDKRIFLSLSPLFFFIILILSCQRNWLEGDKYRIMIEGFLPVYIYFAYGIDYIIAKGNIFKKFALIFISLLLPIIFVHAVSAVNFNYDKEFYSRKYLYQQESKSYYESVKKFFQNISLLPNYKRLFAKLDMRKKRMEEKLMFKRIFPKERLPNYDKLRGFYSDWKAYFLKDFEEDYKYSFPVSYDYVQIDFERLITDLVNSAKRIDFSDICAIDFKNREDLFDVYYNELNVNWQKGALPVCVILNDEEIKYLNVLYIDLNAFAGFGKDSSGFDVVNSVNFKADIKLEEIGFQSGMGSFPLISEGNTMVFCVPKDLTIIIRNWFIDEKGIPYKIDSWCIKRDKNGKYNTKFFYNEPESYL